MLRSPFWSGNVPQPGRARHQSRVTIGKGTHHSRSPSDLFQDPLPGAIGPGSRVVSAREAIIGQGLPDCIYPNSEL
jgi:hypothetical protein